MAEVISSRLIQNLESLKHFYPLIYRKFSRYNQKSNIRLVFNQDGEPDIFFPSTGVFLYSGMTFFQSQKIADDLIDHLDRFSLYPSLSDLNDSVCQIHFEFRNSIAGEVVKALAGVDRLSKADSFPCIILTGLGLGFQLGYLYERMTPLHLYVIEPDPDIFFLSLCCFDYASLFSYIHENNFHLEFRIGNDYSNLIDDLNLYFNNYPVAFAAQCFWFGYCNTPEIKHVIPLLSENFASVTLKRGFFDDLMFSFAHSVNNISSGVPVLFNSRLSSHIKKIPLLLVGNGPSLDGDIDFIRKYQKHFVIMACGTTYATLCKCGVRADIYIALERGVNVYDSLMAIKDHREYFEHTLCIGTEIVYPRVFELFRNRLIILKDNETTPLWLMNSELLPQNEDLLTVSRINPLVSNFGLVVASVLGFKQIFMVGVDNGVIDNPSVLSVNLHSRYSIYEDIDDAGQHKDDNQSILKLFYEYPANFGGKVKTDSLYLSSIRAMESCISRYADDIKYYNCSNGAAIRGAKPFRLKNIKFVKEKLDFARFVHELISNSRSFSFSTDDIKDILDIGGYRNFVDDIIRRLTNAEEDRLQFLQMEEKIFNDIEKTKTKDWYKLFLNGSLIYMLLPVNEYLYSVEESSNSWNKAKSLVNTIVEFLNLTKGVVPRAFEYVQNEHIRIIKEEKRKAGL